MSHFSVHHSGSALSSAVAKLVGRFPAGNMQTDPLKYKSIGTGFGITIREGGLGGLVRGWGPTLVGYSIQGAGKFGLYEFFKK